MNNTEATAWAKRTLGDGTLDVELSTDQITDSLNDTIRWWNKNRGTEGEVQLTLVASQSEYTLPAGTIDVIDVYPPQVAVATIIDSSEFPYPAAPEIPVQGQGLASYHQEVAYLESMRRTFGTSFSWEYVKATRILRILPAPANGGLAIYIARTLLTTIETLAADPEGEDLFLRYLLACMKERLGRHRRKFSDWPAANRTVTLDGDTLVGEAIEEKERLNEEIGELDNPMGILTG